MTGWPKRRGKKNKQDIINENKKATKMLAEEKSDLPKMSRLRPPSQNDCTMSIGHIKLKIFHFKTEILSNF